MKTFTTKPSGWFSVFEDEGKLAAAEVDYGSGGVYDIAQIPYANPNLWANSANRPEDPGLIVAWGSDIGTVKSIKVVDPGINHGSSDTASFSAKYAGIYSTTVATRSRGLKDSLATGIPEISAVLEKGSAFQDNIGFADGSQSIADYNSIQPFSYKLQTTVAPEDYEDIVKTLLHPAGMKLLSKYVIDSTQTISHNSYIKLL